MSATGPRPSRGSLATGNLRQARAISDTLGQSRGLVGHRDRIDEIRVRDGACAQAAVQPLLDASSEGCHLLERRL